MLEVTHVDGRARVADWKPTDAQLLRSPGLLFPQNSLAAAPAWIQAIIAVKPNPAGAQNGRIELLSGGTWFYPTNENATGLVIPAIQPAPSTTVQLVPIGEEVVAFHDAVGWASNPKSMVKALIEARTNATAGKLLWAPGLGLPEDYALWTYLGVDLFDASGLLLAATRGQVLTTDGALSETDAAQLYGGVWNLERTIAHNLEAARLELEIIRTHIQKGTLRGLAERRIYTRAASVELLRRFDREHNYLEAAAPRHRTVSLPAMTSEALSMPEVEAFRRTLRGQYQPPRSAKVLVLLPCSQRKPYKMSRSHRAFQRVLDESGIRPLLHEVMITSPLGMVPREIEEVYPANQYDIPVTGHWMRDEEAVVRQQLAAILDAHQYDHVIVHSGQATFDVLRDLLPEQTRHTCLSHPTSKEDLERLGAELQRLKGVLASTESFKVGRDRRLEDLRSLLTFQFGVAIADEMTEGATAFGRMPYVKLLRGETQLGQTTPDRGVLSLTVEGAQILAKHGVKRVFIQNFKPKSTSSLFAVGVESADPDVRIGDEVVVMYKDEVRGCGVAKMDAPSMGSLKRGVAVLLRHTISESKTKPAAPNKQEITA